jgi:hypothetical protein
MLKIAESIVRESNLINLDEGQRRLTDESRRRYESKQRRKVFNEQNRQWRAEFEEWLNREAAKRAEQANDGDAQQR